MCIFSDLPGTITDFTYSSNSLNVLKFGDLPESITKLDIRLVRYAGEQHHIKRFPSQLIDLCLHGLVSENDIIRMPRSLKKLEIVNPIPLLGLSRTPSVNSPHVLNQTKVTLNPEGEYAWPNNAGHLLPCELESLRICAPDDGNLYNELPGKLTFLDLQTTLELTEQNSLASLPATLRRLLIRSTGKMNNATLQSLPEALERLEITCKLNEMNGECFKFLPRSLLHIVVHHIASVEDDCMKHLPRLLTHFIFPELQDISSNCVPFLPKSLLVISTNRFILAHPRPAKQQILQEMPPFIQYSQLPWTNSKGKPVNFMSLSQ